MSISARPLALALFPLAVAACGGGTPAPAAPTNAASTTTPTGAGTTAKPSAALTAAGSAGSQKAERRTSPSWTSCHAALKIDPAADVSSSVEQSAKACASTTGMQLVQSFKGSQGATNPPQTFTFHADAGHCYRAYAAAGSGIQDLDLLIKDSTGAVAGEDSTDDPTPVVLEDGAVCFKEGDDASVVVSVGAGTGPYAVQVWGD